jgi:hypothetical protein
MKINELKVQAYDLSTEINKDLAGIETKKKVLVGLYNQIETLEKEQPDAG